MIETRPCFRKQTIQPSRRLFVFVYKIHRERRYARRRDRSQDFNTPIPWIFVRV